MTNLLLDIIAIVLMFSGMFLLVRAAQLNGEYDEERQEFDSVFYGGSAHAEKATRAYRNAKSCRKAKSPVGGDKRRSANPSA